MDLPAPVKDIELAGVSKEAPRLWDAFRENQLGLFASAISFQVVTSIVPLLLFVLGMLGFLDITEIWQRDVRPHVEASMSLPARQVLDDTVTRVLTSKQAFWVTAGALLAIWQTSGAVRAAMDALNRVYGIRERRPWKERYGMSIALAIVDMVLVVGAIAVITLLPVVDGDPPPYVDIFETVARWGAAGAMICVAVALVVRYAPDCEQPLGWVSVGTLLVVVSWLVMTALFFLYVTEVASYGSVFGSLATIVVLFGYVYASAIVFVAGLQTDALLRARAAST
jgi:membrane protein